MRGPAQRVVTAALRRSGFLSALRKRSDSGRAVILRYHSVSAFDEQSRLHRSDAIAVRPRTFERQMSFIASAYNVLPLTEIVHRLESGGSFPPRAVAITFDDGYMDNFTMALPILRRYDLPATVYVLTDAIGDGWRFWIARLRFMLLSTKRAEVTLGELGTFELRSTSGRLQSVGRLLRALKRTGPAARSGHLERLARETGITEAPAAAAGWMMGWAELREMAGAGIEIGAHSRTHPILPRLSDAEVRDEVAGSRRVLQQGLDRPVEHFAYPNGGGVPNHDARVQRLVQEAGLRSAVTSDDDAVRSDDDRWSLCRVGMAERHGVSGLAFALERDRFWPRAESAPPRETGGNP